MFTAALFTASKVWQQRKGPLMEERDLYLGPSLKSHFWEIPQRELFRAGVSIVRSRRQLIYLKPTVGLWIMCYTQRRNGRKDLDCIHLQLTSCLLPGGCACLCVALLLTHMHTNTENERLTWRARWLTSSNHRRTFLLDTFVWFWREIASQKYSTPFWNPQSLWGLIEKSKLLLSQGSSAVFASLVPQSFIPSFPLAQGFSASTLWTCWAKSVFAWEEVVLPCPLEDVEQASWPLSSMQPLSESH